MPFGITSEHRALAASLEQLAARECPCDGTRAAVVALQAGERPPSWAPLVSHGFTALAVRGPLGGSGADLLTVAIAAEAAGYGLVPGQLLTTLLAGVVLDGADCDTTEHWSARIVSGAAAAVSLGVSELRARPTPGGLVVDGITGPVLCAPGADLIVLSARVDDTDAWFVIEGADAAVEPLEPLDLTRGLGRVHADGMRVSHRQILAGVTSERVRTAASVLLAAEACGLARWCLQTAVAHVKTRQQFGRPVGAFQAVKHKAATMFTRVEVLSAAAWDAASEAARDIDSDQARLATAAAAALCPSGARDISLDAITLLGGIGYTWEHDITLFSRRAVALSQLAGAPTTWRTRVGTMVRAGVDRVVQPPEADDDAFRGMVRSDLESAARMPEPQRRHFLAGKGYVAPHYPSPYGLDATELQQLVISQELDRAAIPRPSTIIGEFALPTILLHGTPRQQERFVGPTLRGDLVWCQLFSEPEAGSDLAALRTRAERVAGGWRLTGQKIWTSKAHEANWAICLARTDPDAPKHQGLSYFLVDMTSGGIDVRPVRQATGQAEFNEVFLTNVFVADDDLVGSPGAGWRIATTTLANERLMIASGRGSLDPLASLLLAARTAPAADLAVDAAIGTLAAESFALDALGRRALLQRIDGLRPGAETSVLKIALADLKRAAATLALDLASPGATALTADTDQVVMDYLKLPAVLIGGGTREIQLTVIAERVLQLPRG